MASFTIHLMGQATPITLDLPLASVDQLAEQAGQTRYLIGHLSEADGEGVCRRVMVATSRIQCAVEA